LAASGWAATQRNQLRRPPLPRHDRFAGCGTIYGATDEYGYKAVENPLMVHDLHATILHLLGMDHTKLTFRYSGRDMRLTDVHGQVIHDILS